MCDTLKKKPRRNFSENWLKDSRFKSWIRKVEDNDGLFYCSICDKKLSCNLSHVLRHANSTCHKNNMKESTSSLNSNNISSMKRISRKRKFQQKWLDIEQFKPWLCEVQHNENLFFCSICEKSIVGGKSQISRHGKSKAHIKMCEDNAEMNETSETNETNETNESNEDDNRLSNESSSSLLSQIAFEERRRSAEMRFAALIADKHIPHRIAEDILTFFQQIGEDYHVLKNISMGRTKCKNIVTNVIYPVEINRIVSSIKKTKFSIFLDETFDIANEKWTTFFVRYVDPETLDVRSQLVKLIKIDEKNKCEEKLFDVFHNEMTKLDIPFSNIIALACNDASNMKPTYLTFKKKLEETCNNLLTFSCACYSTALAVITAYENIPNYCEEFLQKIANYINSSSKNSALYEEFSDCIQETNCKILKLSEKRWLSHYSYIKKLLESWDTIKFFLAKVDKNDKSKSSSGQDLLDIMEKPEVKAYLLFLKHILHSINSFNAFFKTLETKIHLLQPKSVEFLTIVSKYFLKQKSLHHLCNDIDFSQKEHRKSLYKVNFGSECEAYLEQLTKEGHVNIADIRQNCLQFYAVVAKKISEKLPLNDNFLSKLKVFQGEVALRDRNRDTSFSDVSFIAQSFGFDQSGLKKEWETLHEDFTTSEKQNLIKLNFDDMWKQILQRQDSINNSKYPNLMNLLNAVRSLPNSNTDPEKIFSFISDLKSTKRKKLSSLTINTINVFQSALETKKETVLNMQINAKHLSLMSSDKLYTNCSTKQKNNVTSFMPDNDIDDPLSSNDMQ